MTMLTPPQDAVREGFSPLQRNCDNCGKPFELDKPREAPHKRFCSAHCRDQYHYQRAKATRQAKRLEREASEAYKAWQQAKYKGQSNA